VSPAGSPRAALSLTVALLIGVTIGAAVALLVTARSTDASRRRVVARAAAPHAPKVALAIEVACATGLCQELRLGTSDDATALLKSLSGRTCDEIVWTPDGSRVAFVVDGLEMELYDTATSKLAGTVRLLTAEAGATRLARGITFSENGRAVTFDDCPRGKSGCRAAFVGVPQ
jgi:hypothetical protein